MPLFFDILCYITIFLIIIFTALSYATGLFYLAEQAEEQPTLTKRVLKVTIIVLLVLHVAAFIFSTLPWTSLIIGMLAHASYMHLLESFPDLHIPSVSFFVSVIMLMASQVSWFSQIHPQWPKYSSYAPYQPYSASQCMTFYLLFVWLIPLAFFVTASVSGQSLPMSGVRVDDDTGKSKRSSRWNLSAIARICKREKPVPEEKPQNGYDYNSSQHQSNYQSNYQSNNPSTYPSSFNQPATPVQQPYESDQQWYQQPQQQSEAMRAWTPGSSQSTQSTQPSYSSTPQQPYGQPQPQVRHRSHAQ